MASMVNVLIFTIVLVFMMYLGYAGNYQQYGFKSNMSDTANNQLNAINGSIQGVLNSSVSINTGALFGTISFPNPFSIFWNFFNLLLSLLFAPLVIVNATDLPDIIKVGLNTLLIGLGMFMAYTWYKGQSS